MEAMSALIREYWLYKGKTLQLPIDGLMIDVRVVDLRQRWNTIDAKVSPVSGNGEVWIEARRLINPV